MLLHIFANHCIFVELGSYLFFIFNWSTERDYGTNCVWFMRTYSAEKNVVSIFMKSGHKFLRIWPLQHLLAGVFLRYFWRFRRNCVCRFKIWESHKCCFLFLFSVKVHQISQGFFLCMFQESTLIWETVRGEQPWRFWRSILHQNPSRSLLLFKVREAHTHLSFRFQRSQRLMKQFFFSFYVFSCNC